MSFLRNKSRLNSDKRFFTQTDSYDIPGRLRTIRSKHCYGLPRSISFFEENELESPVGKYFIDEDEAFSKHMSTFWGSIALAGLRALTFFREIFFRKAVPPSVRVSSMSSSSLSEMEQGRLNSKENILARAAETISQTNLLNNNTNLEELVENIVITKDSSDSDMCDGVFKKFKLDIGDQESVQCVEVSLMYEKSFFDNLLAEKHDVRSIVLSEKCACVVWVWSEQTRIVVITESSNSNSWSLQQWHRKVLADMALMDSRLIGHPYYWHPMVRRRLGKVVKRFKKLYRRIEELEAIKKGLPLSTVTLFDSTLRKGNRNRRDYNNNGQSFIEEIEDDSEDTKYNDEFLVKNFVPGCGCWEHEQEQDENSNMQLCKSGSIPIGDCYNHNEDYHMNILDSDTDTSEISGGEDNEYQQQLCRKSKIHCRKSRTQGIIGQHCEEDINHSRIMLNAVCQNSESSSARDDRVFNRRMSSESFESHASGNTKSKHKKRRNRRQSKGDHCIVPMENSSSDSQEVIV